MKVKRNYEAWESKLIKYAYRLAYICWQIYLRTIGGSTVGAQIVVFYQGKVLLVKSCYRPCHSFPGGYRSGSETPSQNALRELKEETGLVLNEDQIVLVKSHVCFVGKSHCVDHLFKAEIETKDLKHLNFTNPEIEWFGFYKLSELYRLPVDDFVAEYFGGKDRCLHFSNS